MTTHIPEPAAILASLALCLACSNSLEPTQRTPSTASTMAAGPVGAPATGGAGNVPSGAGVGGQVMLPAGSPLPAMGQLRRLTPEQYGRALGDLVGLASPPEIDDFPAGDSLRAIAASVTALTPLNVEQFETATFAALAPVFADGARRDALVGCAPVGWDQACATSFLSSFGRRAWRRPLSTDEVARYLALGNAEATDTGKFADGARAMLAALLQSPNFLYRPELGTSAPLSGTVSRFTPYETASRLSFLLWGGIPDEQLLTSAGSGALDTLAGIQAEAQRLIASPRLVDGINDMVDDLLSLRSVFLMAKDQTLFPQLTLTLRVAMREEVRRMFQDVAITRDTDALELFDTKNTFVNQEAAALYGIPGITGAEIVAAQHPSGIPRAGLLTSALILSVQDKPQQTSPTRRGAFLRRVITCDEIPAPPANVNTNIPDPPDGHAVSRKEKLTSHLALGAACSACHSLMDPVGLAFENFDALGIYRTVEENGLPIDPSGQFDGQAFANAAELGALLHQSDKVRSCFTRRIYRYAMGRLENDYDNAQIQQLATTFTANGQRLRSLLVSLVANDGFLNVSAPQ